MEKSQETCFLCLASLKSLILRFIMATQNHEQAFQAFFLRKVDIQLYQYFGGIPHSEEHK